MNAGCDAGRINRSLRAKANSKRKQVEAGIRVDKIANIGYADFTDLEVYV